MFSGIWLIVYDSSYNQIAMQEERTDSFNRMESIINFKELYYQEKERCLEL